MWEEVCRLYANATIPFYIRGLTVLRLVLFGEMHLVTNPSRIQRDD